MAWRFVVAPQWQGSPSSRAMRLVDGAEAIRGDLPSTGTVDVEAPAGAGDGLGTAVHRLSSILTLRDRLAEVLESVDGDDIPLVIGGDCGVELAAVRHAVASDPTTYVLWLDAHPDLNTPDSSPSGAFSGMVLRTLLGDGDTLATPDPVLTPDRVALVGARALDDEEARYIEESGIRRFDADSTTPDEIADAIVAAGAGSVYLHIDLDVLDPAEIQGVASAEPFGLALADVTGLIAAVRDRLPLSGAAILGFAPESPAAASADLPTILRILSAITARR